MKHFHFFALLLLLFFAGASGALAKARAPIPNTSPQPVPVGIEPNISHNINSVQSQTAPAPQKTQATAMPAILDNPGVKKATSFLSYFFLPISFVALVLLVLGIWVFMKSKKD